MLKIWNTLTREKEDFNPIKDGKVSIYTCGPTVYSRAHIGNMRTYIFMDTLRKVLKYNGYELNHVMNITDVGHLTSDADEGEDKMEKSAKEKNMSVYEIAKIYTDAFFKDIGKLNIETPEHVVKATEHIKQMEEYVIEIMNNGYAYETSKGIYFDTSKLKSYGELSRIDLNKQRAGARIEVDPEKRNPLDFALWIKAPKEHIMKWDSKFGKCYPGWHIECSAMSKEYLGDVFDIHTGGVDHIPVHHENEIAQAKGATGKNPAHYWMHVEFLLIDNGKMSKSLKNVYLIDDLEKKGIEPLAYRYLCFTSHYRNKLNFTWDSVESAQKSLIRLRKLTKTHEFGDNKIDEEKVKKYELDFIEAINDDLNMPLAVSIAWEVAKQEEKSKQLFELLMKFDKVLSLNLNEELESESELPEKIVKLLKERDEARKNKNFELSDMIRDKIKEEGYAVKDTKEGQKVERL